MTLLDSIYLKAEALRIPLHVQLELTQRCNANCIHCYIKGARDKLSFSRDDKELTLVQIARLLDELVEEGALNLTFTGGEAMLREDFFDIANAAKKRNFTITIFSNGQLIDIDAANRLRELMPVCVYFSVYGWDANTHDGVTRSPGSFRRLLNVVQLLKIRGIKIGFKTMVLKHNFHQIRKIFKLGKELGIETHEFAEEITAKIDGSCQPKFCQLDDYLMYEYYKGDIPSTWEYIEDSSQEEALKKQLCGAGVFGVCVSSYGDVFPCVELRIPLGNVKYQSFKYIWHKEEGYLAELRSVKEYKDLVICRSCKLVNFCRRCPGRAFYDSGDWRDCYANAYQRALLEKRINDELVEEVR